MALVPGKVSLASEALDSDSDAEGRSQAWHVLRKVFETAGITL